MKLVCCSISLFESRDGRSHELDAQNNIAHGPTETHGATSGQSVYRPRSLQASSRHASKKSWSTGQLSVTKSEKN